MSTQTESNHGPNGSHKLYVYMYTCNGNSSEGEVMQLGGRSGAEEALRWEREGWEWRKDSMAWKFSKPFSQVKKERMNASWLSGICSRNWKRLPHSKLNQCNSLCEQTQKERKLGKSWTIWEGWRNRWGRGRQEQPFRARNYHHTSGPAGQVLRPALASGHWRQASPLMRRAIANPVHHNGFVHILGL